MARFAVGDLVSIRGFDHSFYDTTNKLEVQVFQYYFVGAGHNQEQHKLTYSPIIALILNVQEFEYEAIYEILTGEFGVVVVSTDVVNLIASFPLQNDVKKSV